MPSRLCPHNLQIGRIDAGLGLGKVDSISNVGGIARISHIIGRERARAGRALHIDGGDCFQGAPVFNFFSGEAEIRALSAMGVDAMLIANHEFDAGANNLMVQLQQWATFPALAANYKLEDASQPGASPLEPVFDPFQVFDANGLRVAVIGMANLSSLSSIFDSPNRLGITPLPTAQIAQAYIDLLRPSVDLIVMVSHLGLEHDEDMIQNTTGIDVVLGGHNHIVLQPPKKVRDCSERFDEATGSFYIDVDGPVSGEKLKRYCKPREVVLAHSGAFAKYVGRLDLVLSNAQKDLPARRAATTRSMASRSSRRTSRSFRSTRTSPRIRSSPRCSSPTRSTSMPSPTSTCSSATRPTARAVRRRRAATRRSATWSLRACGCASASRRISR